MYYIVPSGEFVSDPVRSEARFKAHRVAAKNAATKEDFFQVINKECLLPIAFTPDSIYDPNSTLRRVMAEGIPAYWDWDAEGWRPLEKDESRESISQEEVLLISSDC